MKRHALIDALLRLSGNARACVYTEPIWGIPFNLYAPYISVYMIALGLGDRQIGLIASITGAVQIGMMLISGVVTDKLGRRRTTLITDLLAWSIPALISGLAQNFWWFLIAGLFNTTWRISFNSWSCLLVEDTDPDDLVTVYTWIAIANQLVGFVAPLAGVIIASLGLVPTVRGLYFFAAGMFALKAFVTYWFTSETRQGLVRIEETRYQSVFSVLREYKGVLGALLHTPKTLYTAAILLTMQITWVIGGNFWAIIVTQKVGVPNEYLAAFPFIKSAIILTFFFALMPKIDKMHFKMPLTLGFLTYLAAYALLVAAPREGYLLLVISVCLEACAYAVVGPLMDKLTALTIEAKERARIQAIMWMVIILLTSPFGWIAGMLSEMDKRLPFVLMIALYAVGAALVYLAGVRSQREQAAGQ